MPEINNQIDEIKNDIDKMFSITIHSVSEKILISDQSSNSIEEENFKLYSSHQKSSFIETRKEKSLD